MDISNLKEKDLQELIASGNEEFIKTLYLNAYNFLHKRKYFDEDFVQDLVTYVWKHLKDFDSSKAKFTTFLWMKFENKFLGNLRYFKAGKRNAEILSLDEIYVDKLELVTQIPDFRYIPSKEYQKNLIREIYNNLSPLTKKYFNGITQAELANEYNLSQAQISRKINKEIKEIKNKYDIGGKTNEK